MDSNRILYNKKVGEEKYQPYMVTNRHVVEGKDILVIRMKEKDTGKLREFDMPITENGRKLYIAHENKNIDIAVITINGGFINANNLSFSAFDIDAHALSLHRSSLRMAGMRDLIRVYAWIPYGVGEHQF